MGKKRIIAAGMCLLAGALLAVLWADTATAEPRGKDTAAVIGKAPNCIVITDYRLDIGSNHVLVTPSSRISDIDGTALALEQLRIPCTASLRIYQSSTRPDAELRSLQVQEYGPDASDRFTMKEPFVRSPE